jgi:hypothetical protein
MQHDLWCWHLMIAFCSLVCAGAATAAYTADAFQPQHCFTPYANASAARLAVGVACFICPYFGCRGGTA